ncbi:MAG: hypothetical protein KA180_07025 [Gemmatimonadales bacterium]|nr:hypothetical protein [Gemmatimonadales bacterium]MBP9198768.1 hypothetical protein [Gemmatimonadales bacterium]
MTGTSTVLIGQRVVAVIAALFGLATLFAGGRVLLGSDPGYVVFRPLLIYNTAMGLAYLAAGLLLWTKLRQGQLAAATIFGLNLAVLVGIVIVHRGGGGVAVDSLRAMTVRTVVWLGLFAAAAWLGRMLRRGATAPAA